MTHKDTQVKVMVASLSTGVDYLTVTTRDNKTSPQLLARAARLMARVHTEGHSPKNWRWMGYSGYQTASFRYGVRGDEGIVVLSSEMAREHWREFTNAGSRVTRIDLAVTVRLYEQYKSLAKDMYQEAMKANARLYGYVERSIGGSTLYVGSRESERFGRLYDKGAHLGEEAGWTWRYEVEVKKPLSSYLAQSLFASDDVPSFIVSYVHDFFTLRNVAPVFDKSDYKYIIESEGRIQTREKQLHWLRTSVAPTVSRLIELEGEEKVLGALNLGQYLLNLQGD